MIRKHKWKVIQIEKKLSAVNMHGWESETPKEIINYEGINP